MKFYNGKVARVSKAYLLSDDLLKQAKTKYSIEAANKLMTLVEQRDPNVMITLQDMHS